MPECNSAGLAMMPGKPMDALDQIPEIDNLLILENDIFRRAHSDFLERLLQKSKNVIAIDCIQSSTASHAHIVLPAASFAEARGTLVNNEGRAQRFYNALVGEEPITESWKWLDALQQLSGRGEAAAHFDRLTQLLVDELPAFAKLIDITPTAGAHRQACRVPRQTDRFSGRTANKAHIAVSETAPIADDDSPLAFSMEGCKENTDPSLIPFYWVPNWNSVQAFYKYIPEANGPLKYGDPGVKLRLIPGTDVTDLKPLSHPDPEKWKWYMVPVLSIFGSEELSTLAPAIAERMQSPCVFMNSFDAESASFSEGDLLEISTPDTHINLPLRLDDTMAQGCAGILFASPGMPFMDFPLRAEMKKA
jgi:NADH-quinone oxidoreductase subunit G